MAPLASQVEQAYAVMMGALARQGPSLILATFNHGAAAAATPSLGAVLMARRLAPVKAVKAPRLGRRLLRAHPRAMLRLGCLALMAKTPLNTSSLTRRAVLAASR